MRGVVREKGRWTDRLTMMAPSSMMQPEPMTMGPAMAKMVALGWTIVPGGKAGVSGRVAREQRTDLSRW